jgi:hypothetical protein
MKRLAASACLAILAFVPRPCRAQQQKERESHPSAAQSKPIFIGVKVEAEGGGKGQGMWTQAATDLTPQELKTLESLVVAEIKKQEGVKIVPLDYPNDHIGLVVVAAKLPNGNAEKWNYIASSVVLVATKKGIDELVTHDVIAGSDLALLARTIGYQFAVVKFRAATGLRK